MVEDQPGRPFLFAIATSARGAHIGGVCAGSGELNIYRVEQADLIPLEPAHIGHFNSGYSYICLYSYHDRTSQKHMIYFWQGEPPTCTPWSVPSRRPGLPSMFPSVFAGKHSPKGSWPTWHFDLKDDLIRGLTVPKGKTGEGGGEGEGEENSIYQGM